MNLGTALRRLGEREKAVEVFRDALARDPTNPQAHWGLGVVLGELGRTERAVIELEKAVELAPDLPGPRLSLGAILCDRLHRFEDAIAQFERAIALRTDDLRTYFNLAAALQASGEPERAVSMARRATDVDPGFANAYILLGNLLYEAGELEAARAALRRATELAPEQPSARLNLGAVLTRTGDWRGAKEIYEALLPVRAPSGFRGFLLNNLAWLLAVCPEEEIRDPKRALALARRAVGLLPQEPSVLSTLGLALYRCDQMEEAVEVLEKAVARAPTADLKVSGRLVLAMALHGLDRGDEAASLLKSCLDWIHSTPHQNPDLDLLRAEAEALILGPDRSGERR